MDDWIERTNIGSRSVAIAGEVPECCVIDVGYGNGQDNPYFEGSPQFGAAFFQKKEIRQNPAVTSREAAQVQTAKSPVSIFSGDAWRVRHSTLQVGRRGRDSE